MRYADPLVAWATLYVQYHWLVIPFDIILSKYIRGIQNISEPLYLPEESNEKRVV